MGGARTQAGLTLALALASAAYLVWLARFLLALPPDLPCDDALFFSRALTRFSILDYSPHFPGYPAFVGLSRLALQIWPDPAVALIRTSLFTSLALPAAAALITWRWTRSCARASLCFALVLAQPFLPLAALSGLSDSTGLLFFLMFFALLPDQTDGASNGLKEDAQIFLAGLALGLSAATRPSDGLVLAAAFAPIAFSSRRTALALSAGALAAALPSLLALMALEGWGYFAEGWRFFEGHMLGWGNTVLSRHPHSGWSHVLTHGAVLGSLVLPYAALLLCCHLPRGNERQSAALLASLLVAALWTLLFQNPEHLRHLLPVTTLLAVAVSHHLKHIRAGSAAGLGTLMIASILLRPPLGSAEPAPAHAPLQAAVETINRLGPDAVVLAQDDLALLRTRLTQARVYDLTYPASTAASLKGKTAVFVKISAQRGPKCRKARFLPGRVPGEQGLWLCQPERWPPDS